MSFAQASAVLGGPGRWKAELPEGWDIFGVTNGGFLMSIATRAMGAEADGRQLISATGTYVNPASAGPIDIDVEVLKSGRNLSTLRSAISRDGRPLTYVTAVHALRERPKPDEDLVLGEPPSLPDPEDCAPVAPAEDAPIPPPFVGKIDLRVHPDDANLGERPRSETPMIRGWFRLLDDEPLDAHAVVMAADSWPPAIFTSTYRAGWTPTVELSVQVRDPVPSGWLAGRFATKFVTEGMLEEDGELWDEAGRLVALSRQLALVPR